MGFVGAGFLTLVSTLSVVFPVFTSDLLTENSSITVAGTVGESHPVPFCCTLWGLCSKCQQLLTNSDKPLQRGAILSSMYYLIIREFPQ